MAIADVASNFISQSKGVSPTMGAARGLKAGTVIGQRSREIDRRETQDQFNRAAYWGKLDREAQIRERETAGGVAAMTYGRGPEVYDALKKTGKYPLLDNVDYEELPIFAGVTKKGAELIKQGKADDLAKFEKDQVLIAQKMEERKQDEVERNNRAKNKADKLKNSKADRNKSGDAKTIKQFIADSGYIDREWDDFTGKWVIKDEAASKEVQAITSRALKLFNDNPDMSHPEAVDKALRAGGYAIKTPSGEAPAFSSPQDQVRSYDPESRTLR